MLCHPLLPFHSFVLRLTSPASHSSPTEQLLISYFLIFFSPFLPFSLRLPNPSLVTPLNSDFTPYCLTVRSVRINPDLERSISGTERCNSGALRFKQCPAMSLKQGPTKLFKDLLELKSASELQATRIRHKEALPATEFS